MKRKLHLHRDTVRNLESGDLAALRGGALLPPTVNPYSCVYICPVPTVKLSCGGTCTPSCFNLC